MINSIITAAYICAMPEVKLTPDVKIDKSDLLAMYAAAEGCRVGYKDSPCLHEVRIKKNKDGSKHFDVICTKGTKK